MKKKLLVFPLITFLSTLLVLLSFIISSEKKAINLSHALRSTNLLSKNISFYNNPSLSFRVGTISKEYNFMVLKRTIKSTKKRKLINKVKRKKVSVKKTIRIPKILKMSEISKIKIINNKELIKHYGFESETLVNSNWVSYFEKINLTKKLANLNSDEESKEIPENKISLIQNDSYPNFKNDETNIDLLIDKKISKVKKENKDDELIFYDYPEKIVKQEVNLKQASQLKKRVASQILKDSSLTSHFKISSNVQKVIKRELKKSMRIAPRVSEVSSQRSLGSQLAKYMKKGLADHSTSKVDSQNFKEKSHASKEETITHLIAKEISFNDKNSEKVFDYQFIPEYEKNETLRDEDGTIILRNALNSSYSLLRGTITKYGLMRTKIEIPLEFGEEIFEIPVITQNSMLKILEDNNLEGYGGHLLVELSEEIDDVDIDKDYESRLFITEDFKVTERDEEYRYILFLGIVPGNIFVKYLLQNGKISEKVSHISSDEILFEIAKINGQAIEKIKLSERYALGSTNSQLDINTDQMEIFGSDSLFSKEGLNIFEAEFPSIPLGMRNYVELKHLDDSIFIGFGDIKSLEVPSRDFIENVLTAHDMEELNGQCVVQFNFSNKIKRILVDGDSDQGAMSFRKSFLDRDGVFNEDISSISEKLFLIGDSPGVFNLKIEYINNTVDYLQTFCFKSTYLVEHL